MADPLSLLPQGFEPEETGPAFTQALTPSADTAVTDPAAALGQIQSSPQPVQADPMASLPQGFEPEAQQDPTVLGGQENVVTQGLSGFNEGLAQVLGLPVDIINKAVDVVSGGTLASDQPFLGSQQIQEFLTRQGAIAPESADPTKQIVRRVGQEIGATAPAATGIGALARFGVAAQRVPVVREAVSQATRTPGRFAAAEAGLATTSGVGAATAQQIAPDSPGAELVGQLAGGIGPTAVAGAARRLVPGRANIPRNVAAFETAGATPSLGQATENDVVSIIETTVGSIPGGRGRLVRFAADTQEKIGQRIDELVSGLTTKPDPTRAGKVIKQGIIGEGGFLDRFKEASTRIFNQIPIRPQTAINVTKTQDLLAQLTAPIQGFERTSGELVSPVIKRIAETFLEDVQQTGTAPWQAIKELRTKIGELAFSTDLLADVPRGQLKRLYGALADDMKIATDAAGPDARRAFDRANKFYSDNVTVIDDFLNKVTNKADPADVFRFATQGKEGATRIGTIRNSLKPNEWKAVAGTVLKRLGKANPSNQDDVGEIFSAETFLTNWNKIDKSAKDALFKGKQFGTLRSDLDRISRAAKRIREGSRVLFNPSGTGNRLINILPGAAAVGGAGAGSMPIVLLALSTPALANASARLMTNPKFIRWLAQSTRITSARLPGHIARLSSTLKDEVDALPAANEFIEFLTQEPQAQPQPQEVQ